MLRFAVNIGCGMEPSYLCEGKDWRAGYSICRSLCNRPEIYQLRNAVEQLEQLRDAINSGDFERAKKLAQGSWTTIQNHRRQIVPRISFRGSKREISYWKSYADWWTKLRIRPALHHRWWT